MNQRGTPIGDAPQDLSSWINPNFISIILGLIYDSVWLQSGPDRVGCPTDWRPWFFIIFYGQKKTTVRANSLKYVLTRELDVVVVQLSNASLKQVRIVNGKQTSKYVFFVISNRKRLARTITCTFARGKFEKSYDSFSLFLLLASRIFKVRSGSPERHVSFLRSRFACAILSLIRVEPYCCSNPLFFF